VAKIEIEESELANLKRVNDVAALIGKNPKARAMLQQAVVEAAPDQAGPEHYLRSEFTEAIGGIREDLAKDREERAKEKQEREAENAKRALESRWLEGRAKLRADGVMQEGIEAVEKLMEDEGIPSHEAARLLYEKRNPPPEPAVTGGSRWNFFDRAAEGEHAKAFQSLMDGDDEAWLAHSIPAALKEARGG
jgi:hypothetical protein